MLSLVSTTEHVVTPSATESSSSATGVRTTADHDIPITSLHERYSEILPGCFDDDFSLEAFDTLLIKWGIDKKTEFAALDEMRAKAAVDGFSPEIAAKVFDAEYGATNAERLFAFLKSHDLPPSEMDKANYGFVNESFIRAKKMIAEVTKSVLKSDSLFFHFGDLYRIPRDIGLLTHIKDLDFANNKIAILPNELGNLTNLTTLNLRENYLTKLFSGLKRLTHLVDLDLQRNEFTRLPEEIGDLKALTRLRVNNNGLEALPESLWHLTELTTLCLFTNKLTILPNGIGKLTKLMAT